MPSSHRFSDPAEENNILNHVISEDLQKYGFMYSSLFPHCLCIVCGLTIVCRPEFIGRIPRIVPLHPLREDDLVSILQEPEDSLLSQYQRLLSLSGAVLQFTSGAIRQVAKRA